MKQTITVLLVILFSAKMLSAQSKTESAQKAQDELNTEYRGAQSPLTADAKAKFTGLPFFEIDTNFVVMARLERLEDQPTFKMPTTTSRMASYRVYGVAHFILAGQDFSLNIYQSPELMTREGYEDYLFLPFKDQTSGAETYGGGRYIELRIPKGDSLEIDFNKCYNPYCAYNAKYSCPIVPEDNFVDFEIRAGVKNE